MVNTQNLFNTVKNIIKNNPNYTVNRRGNLLKISHKNSGAFISYHAAANNFPHMIIVPEKYRRRGIATNLRAIITHALVKLGKPNVKHYGVNPYSIPTKNKRPPSTTSVQNKLAYKSVFATPNAHRSIFKANNKNAMKILENYIKRLRHLSLHRR